MDMSATEDEGESAGKGKLSRYALGPAPTVLGVYGNEGLCEFEVEGEFE